MLNIFEKLFCLEPSNPPSNDKPNDGGDTTNQSSTQQNNKDQIHISFDG